MKRARALYFFVSVALPASASAAPESVLQTAFFCTFTEVVEAGSKTAQKLAAKQQLSFLLAGKAAEVQPTDIVVTFDPDNLLGGAHFDAFRRVDSDGKSYTVSAGQVREPQFRMLTMDFEARYGARAYTAVIGGPSGPRTIGFCQGLESPTAATFFASFKAKGGFPK